jgi:hypothetical protein
VASWSKGARDPVSATARADTGDGKYLAVITGHGQYGYDRRWQLTTRRLITTFKSAQDQEGIAAAFSPDGKTLADNFGAQTHLYSLG